MAAGFYGFVDFTGLPAGEGVAVPPSGGGLTVAGKRKKVIRRLLQAEVDEILWRESLRHREQVRQVQERLNLEAALRYLEYEREKQRMVDTMIFSTLLAEV